MVASKSMEGLWCNRGLWCNTGMMQYMECIQLSRETCTKGLLQHMGRSGTQWMDHLP